MKQNSELMEGVNLSEFTNRLKKEDVRYANLSKSLQIIYWVLAPVYLISTIVHIINTSPVVDIIGSFCLFLAMLIFAVLFRYYSRDYKNVDYSQTTLVMLKKAAYRYKPFRLSVLWALLGALLVYVSFYINSSLSDRGATVFLGGIGLGVIIGLIIWWIRYKPLYEGARKLIREIEGKN